MVNPISACKKCNENAQGRPAGLPCALFKGVCYSRLQRQELTQPQALLYSLYRALGYRTHPVGALGENPLQLVNI